MVDVRIKKDKYIVTGRAVVENEDALGLIDIKPFWVGALDKNDVLEGMKENINDEWFRVIKATCLVYLNDKRTCVAEMFFNDIELRERGF